MADNDNWEQLMDANPAPALPPQIQNLVRGLLRRFRGSDPLRDDPAFREVAGWLAEHADELGVFDAGGDPVTPIIPEAEIVNLSDELLLESLDEPDDVVIDDEMRAAFVTAHFHDLLTHEIAVDSDYHPACGTLALVADDGERALIGFGTRGHSFSGIELDWFGLFESREGFVQHLRDLGWLIDLGDLEAMSRERKLTLWDRTEFG